MSAADAVEAAKALLMERGYVVLKEKSYRAAQERQRIAEARMRDAIDYRDSADQWMRGDLFPTERHLRNRLNYIYGIAVAHGATDAELDGGACDCGRHDCIKTVQS